MNKREVIDRVAVLSGVDTDICVQVLDAFEEVLTEELNGSAWKGSLFDKVHTVMSFVKTKKDKKS